MLSRSALQTIAVLALLTLFVFSASDFSFDRARHDQIRNVRNQSFFWRFAARVPINASTSVGASLGQNARAVQEKGSSYIQKSLTSVSSVRNAAQRDHAINLAGPNQTPDSAGTPQAQLQNDVLSRCQHSLGDWCRQSLSANRSLPSTPQPPGGKKCTADCSIVGNCNADTGVCDCPAGWKGDGCLQSDPRPCTNRYRSSGWVAQGEPASWSEEVVGPKATGMCTGICDDDIGACFCNGTFANPELPRRGTPTRYPPAISGRPLGIRCQPNRVCSRLRAVPLKDIVQAGQGDVQADDEIALSWGEHDPEKLFGEGVGWCEAQRPGLRCECKLDGLSGELCETPLEQTCINQCSGHGVCYLGFCACFQGWYGHACHRHRMQHSSAEELNVIERPWVERHLRRPEIMASSPRKRPLIHIYDLPAEFNTRMHQYRLDKHTCTWRLFSQYRNVSYITSWTYAIEMAFHETLLQSEHYTLDPEQADYFYVPVYTSCFIHPVWGYLDHPWYYGPTQNCWDEDGNRLCATGANRVMQGMFMLLKAKSWIEKELPFWNRTQGADHIWLVTHDEGSCWVPAELRSSIILSHWGRKDKGHRSNSAFAPWDNYTDEVRHPEWWPDGYQKHIDAEKHACYNPAKDLVIPNLKHPAELAAYSPLFGRPERKRSILLLFRGDVGMERDKHYSRGIRQKLYALAQEHDWMGNYKIFIGSRDDIEGDYSQLLASSIFCLMAPGDGFSPRAEDAILHGCLPVVIMDDVDPVFASILDWKSFSVRVPESELEYLPQVLLSISKARIQQMQQALQGVWHRFMWSGLPIFNDILTGTCKDAKRHNTPDSQSGNACNKAPDEDDAFDTIMQWLAAKI